MANRDFNMLLSCMSQEEKDRRRGTCLCHRCEHRALFMETGWQPRCECGDFESSKWSCYMFRPVRPIVMGQSNKEDPRPFMGPAMLASRACAIRAPEDKELRLRAEAKDEGYLVYWEAIRKRRKNEKKVKGKK